MPEREDNIRITGDSSELIEAVQKAIRNLKNLGEQEEAVKKETANFSKTGKQLGGSLKVMIGEAKELEVRYKNVQGQLKATGATLKDTTGKFKEQQKAIEQANEKSRRLTEESKRFDEQVKRQTDPGREQKATKKEKADFDRARRELKEFTKKNEISIGKTRQLWSELNSGEIVNYTGKLGKLKDRLEKVQSTQKNLGKIAEKEAAEAAAAQKKRTEANRKRNESLQRTVALLSKATKAQEGAKRIAKQFDADVRRGVDPADEKEATIEEKKAFADARQRVQDFVGSNQEMAKQTRKIWSELQRGQVNKYSGKLKQLQDRLLKLKKAQEGVGRSAAQNFRKAQERAAKVADQTARAAEKTQQFLLSWESAARIGVIQVFQQSLGNLVQQIQQSIDRASKFQEAIAEIQTIDAADLPFGTWSNELRNLADNWQGDLITQTEAAYQALSNQITQGAQTFQFMRESNRLAVAAVSDTDTAVRALTGTLNAFNLDASQSREVAAKLFKTIELGRVRLNEMADTIGTIAVPASQLNVSLDELLNTISTLTIKGIKFDQSATQIRGILVKLLKPTEAMKDLFAELGVASGEAAIQTFGLQGFLEEMARSTDGSSTGVAKLVNRIRGLGGTLALLQNDMAGFQRNVVRSENALADFEEAVAIVRNNAGRRFRIELEKTKNFFTQDFGTAIINLIDAFTAKTFSLSEILKGASKVILTTVAGAVALLTGRLIQATAASGGLIAAFRSLAAFSPLGLGLAAITTTITIMVQTMESASERARKAFQKIRRSITETSQVARKELVNFAEAFEKAMNKSSKNVRQGLALTAGDFGKILQDQQEVIKELRSTVNTELKNALRTARSEVTEGINKVEDFKQTIEDLRTELNNQPFGTEQKLFDLRLEDKSVAKQLDLVTNRIDSLNKKATEAAEEGNLDVFETLRQRIQSLTSKRQGLIGQAEGGLDLTSTIEDPGKRRLARQSPAFAQMIGKGFKTENELRNEQAELIKSNAEAEKNQINLIIGAKEKQLKQKKREVELDKQRRKRLEELRTTVKEFELDIFEANTVKDVNESFNKRKEAFDEILRLDKESDKDLVNEEAVKRLKIETELMRQMAIERLEAINKRKQIQELQTKINNGVRTHLKLQEQVTKQTDTTRLALEKTRTLFDAQIIDRGGKDFGKRLRESFIPSFGQLLEPGFQGRELPILTQFRNLMELASEGVVGPGTRFAPFADIDKITQATADQITEARRRLQDVFDEQGNIIPGAAGFAAESLRPIIQGFEDLEQTGMRGEQLNQFRNQQEVISQLFNTLKKDAKEIRNDQQALELSQENLNRLRDQLNTKTQEGVSIINEERITLEKVRSNWQDIFNLVERRRASLRDSVRLIREQQSLLQEQGGANNLQRVRSLIEDQNSFRPQIVVPSARGINAERNSDLINQTNIDSMNFEINEAENPQMTAEEIRKKLNRAERLGRSK